MLYGSIDSLRGTNTLDKLWKLQYRKLSYIIYVLKYDILCTHPIFKWHYIHLIHSLSYKNNGQSSAKQIANLTDLIDQ